jgi:hypothetical protein
MWPLWRWPTKRRALPGPCLDMTWITILITLRLDASYASDDRLTKELAREPHLRLQSKPNDGEQVEPALAEPENVRVREARNFDGELARE